MYNDVILWKIRIKIKIVIFYSRINYMLGIFVYIFYVWSNLIFKVILWVGFSFIIKNKSAVSRIK